MHRCEIKRNSACRRESSSLDAELLREGERNSGAVHLHVGLAFSSHRKTSGWRSVPPARRFLQNSNTTWRVQYILFSSSASSTNVKLPNTNAVQALRQSSPAREGSARPNHSVNLRANGIARCPFRCASFCSHWSSRYAVSSRLPRTLGLTMHSLSSLAALRMGPLFPTFAHHRAASASSSHHHAPESVRQGPPPGTTCSPKGVHHLLAVGSSLHTSSSRRKHCRVRPNQSVKLRANGKPPSPPRAAVYAAPGGLGISPLAPAYLQR
jgi:hypothetical protein